MKAIWLAEVVPGPTAEVSHASLVGPVPPTSIAETDTPVHTLERLNEIPTACWESKPRFWSFGPVTERIVPAFAPNAEARRQGTGDNQRAEAGIHV